jgi:sulfite exporter TauE/SafE
MATSPDRLDILAPVEAPAFDPWSRTTRAKTTRGFSVPLVVAVTGHRDLVPAEVPHIRQRVRELLCSLRDAYPERSVHILSGLAEGADRLVAEEALLLGMPLTAVLPMPRELYAQDFRTAESRAAFDELCHAAVDLFELPITPGNTPASISGYGANRARQYAQLGVFLCAHCHVLLALWDGKPSDQLGGTSQVVRFHHDDVMPGYTPRATASRLTLTDDESDLVYHIVCSRDRPDGVPAAGLEPLGVSWFTTDEHEPRTADIPLRHRQVFERANEFTRDVRLHADEIDREKYPLLTEQQAAGMPSGLQDINQVFCAADWLAIHYQKKVFTMLRVSHVCVFLTGLAYVSYTDFQSSRAFLFAVLGLMLVAMGIGMLAARGAWHRKYLDYRTLAEGLRVQFYWAAAGVTSGNVTKFSHDNFLQMQDPDLGWIRNVMRVAGTECDAHPYDAAAGLEFVLKEWLGDEKSGQLAYFARKSAERLRKHLGTVRAGRIGLWASAATLLVLLFVGVGIPESVRVPLVYVMGCVLLAVGVRQSYAKSTAESELIKQYDFMHRIFFNARRRIDAAENDTERRRILKVLGDAALEEHAQWILMHRERVVDRKEIVKLS